VKLEYLPNALCVFRILLVVPILWAIIDGRYEIALLLFVVAGFTDGLDGFLARQFDWRTELGGILDPVADKLLMVTVLVWLTLAGLIPVWLTAVLVGRDLVIVGGAVSYRLLIGPFKGQASTVSKLNTALQLLFVTAVLADAAFSFPGPLAVSVLGSLVFVTAVVSGLHYVRGWTLLALNAGEQA
jgi:cardiolipin synthase